MAQSGNAGNQPATGSPMRVVVWVCGELLAPQLWTLRQLAGVARILHVVRVPKADDADENWPERTMGHRLGLRNPLCALGAKLIGEREVRAQRQLLDRLFDGDYLRAWWQAAGIEVADVTQADHPDACVTVAGPTPDILVSLIGKSLPRHTAALAHLTALSIHITNPPRVEFIGASIQAIDRVNPEPRVVWREPPHVAPGDTGDILVFKAQVQAVGALLRLLRIYQEGAVPPSWPLHTDEKDHVLPPHLWDWMKYMATGRGRRARFSYEKAIHS
jgi:hypothetical protein